MLSTILRRQATVLAIAGLVVVPLSACGSGSTPTADAPKATPVLATIAGSSADADAVWSVLRTLPAPDVATLHAGFTVELQEALANIVYAVAASGL